MFFVTPLQYFIKANQRLVRMDFTFEKCKTKAGYSAKLKRKIKLDLKAISKEFETLLETPILLVIKEKGIEIIVHRYGELLFKESKIRLNEKIELMKEIAKKVYGVGKAPRVGLS
jgi:hypothetical protein